MNILIASPAPDRAPDEVNTAIYQQCTGIANAVRALLERSHTCQLSTLSYTTHCFNLDNMQLYDSNVETKSYQIDLIIQICLDSNQPQLDVSDTTATLLLYPAFPYSLVQNEIGMKCRNIRKSESIHASIARFLNTYSNTCSNKYSKTCSTEQSVTSTLPSSVDPSVHYAQFTPIELDAPYEAGEHILIAAFGAPYPESKSERRAIFAPLSELAYHLKHRTRITLVTDLYRDKKQEDELLKYIYGSVVTDNLSNNLAEITTIDSRAINLTTLVSLLSKSDHAIFLGNGLYADSVRYSGKTYTCTDDQKHLKELVSADVSNVLTKGYHSGHLLPNRIACLAYVLGTLTDNDEIHLSDQYNENSGAMKTQDKDNYIIIATVTSASDIVTSTIFKLDTYRKKLRKLRESPSRFITDSSNKIVRRLIPLVKS